MIDGPGNAALFSSTQLATDTKRAEYQQQIDLRRNDPAQKVAQGQTSVRTETQTAVTAAANDPQQANSRPLKERSNEFNSDAGAPPPRSSGRGTLVDIYA